MKTFKIEFRVTKAGVEIDSSRIHIIAENADKAETAAYDLLDAEYAGVGRVKVQNIVEM